MLASVPSAIDDATADRLRARDSGSRRHPQRLGGAGSSARWPLPLDSAERVVAAAPNQWRARIAEGPDPFELLADYGVPVV